jgi:hypothetical protein
MVTRELALTYSFQLRQGPIDTLITLLLASMFEDLCPLGPIPIPISTFL